MRVPDRNGPAAAFLGRPLAVRSAGPGILTCRDGFDEIDAGRPLVAPDRRVEARRGWMARVSAGWVTLHRSAARVKFSVSDTARK